MRSIEIAKFIYFIAVTSPSTECSGGCLVHFGRSQDTTTLLQKHKLDDVLTSRSPKRAEARSPKSCEIQVKLPQKLVHKPDNFELKRSISTSSLQCNTWSPLYMFGISLNLFLEFTKYYQFIMKSLRVCLFNSESNLVIYSDSNPHRSYFACLWCTTSPTLLL